MAFHYYAMRFAVLAVSVCAAAGAAAVDYEESSFTAGRGGKPAGWSVWSARPETAPRTYVDGGALVIAGNGNVAEHGGWERRIDGVAPGKWYRFSARYRTEAVAAESWQVVARLDWRAESGRASEPDYVYQSRPEDDWTRVWLDAQAPASAAAVVLQLYLSNSPQGTVWWDEVAFRQIPDPGPRQVTVTAVNLWPQRSPDNVGEFLAAAAATAPAKSDVILLPEGITFVGTGKKFEQVAEKIPGPTTARLGAFARKRRSYVAAGIYEREGAAIYNTAVLIDRDGSLVGKYRKVYLPREEVEGGLTPGSEYPVFRTDFGVIGLMICYDVFYADPARALARKGAEMILMPIWGGDETLAKARAIENKVFLVASGYDHPTYIMDPNGERISEAPKRGTSAVATVDLNLRYRDPHLGDMRGRRAKELRVDVE
jgi:predicted amidohydrolase